jgi:hypothetical protein
LKLTSPAQSTKQMKSLTTTKKINVTLEHDQESEVDLKVFSPNHVNNKEDSEDSDQEEAVVKKKIKRNTNDLVSSKKLKKTRSK